jgi:CelD/BcsL family acetyltransferase involved in cellulose biosynthesis
VDLAVEWIEDVERFRGLERPWDALLHGESLPFDRHCWYAAWWSSFGGRGQLAVCTAWRGDELAAAIPLFRPRSGCLESLANLHTPVFRPLGRDPAALEAVATAVAGSRPTALLLNALPALDSSLPALQRGAEAAGLLTLLETQHVSPIVDTSGSFEDWRERSKERWGAPLERFRRKMARDHGAEFSIVEPALDLERELEEGFELEASGWKGSAGTAILSSEATTRFYREVAQSFAARDELRLSRIVLDGRPAAFDLTLLHGGRLYLLKTGYDERFRKLAPGLVMRLSIIERCFELGLEAHELLGDDSEWKRKFSTAERAHRVFRAYRRGIGGLRRYAYRSRLRPLLKAVRRRGATGLS